MTSKRRGGSIVFNVSHEVMDNVENWRSAGKKDAVLMAGVSYLYELLSDRHPKCLLGDRIRALGAMKEKLEAEKHGNAAHLFEQAKHLIREVHVLGTIGYSLWHLKPYMNSPGFRHEFEELTKTDVCDDTPGTEHRLRGQGFMFHSAGTLARDGFEIKFIKEKTKSPDFFAIRDSNCYACEATTKSPREIRSKDVGGFIEFIRRAVEEKREKFKLAAYQDGVLLVDCTPVFHLLKPEHLPIGGQLTYRPGKDMVGPPETTVPLVRYDQSEFSVGLRMLAGLIQDVGIRNLMFWNRELSFDGDEFRHRVEHRIFGTIGGRVFWAYFPNSVVFPAKGVDVKW